jgi:hypothetical protein
LTSLEEPLRNSPGAAANGCIFGTTSGVIDCAGKVVLSALVVLPFAGGETVIAGCATMPAMCALPRAKWTRRKVEHV